MIHETPEIYEKYVKPYITAFPASRTKWYVVHRSLYGSNYPHCDRVENILTGVSEQNKVLYSCSDFLILPDMKWDLTTLSSLYLVAIVQDRSIRSIRDLRHWHLGLLKAIRSESIRVVRAKWGMGNGSLRMYIHYQPSYCEPPFYDIRYKPLIIILRPFPCAHSQRQLRRRSTWHGGRPSSSPRRCYLSGLYSSTLATNFPLIVETVRTRSTGRSRGFPENDIDLCTRGSAWFIRGSSAESRGQRKQ